MKHIWIFCAKELEITDNQSLCYFKFKRKNVNYKKYDEKTGETIEN